MYTSLLASSVSVVLDLAVLETGDTSIPEGPSLSATVLVPADLVIIVPVAPHRQVDLFIPPESIFRRTLVLHSLRSDAS